jgi:RluA family pseudouridine synthase
MRHNRPQQPFRRGPPQPLEVVFLDDHLVIAVKPDNMLVNMSETGELTLQDMVREEIPRSPAPDAMPAAAIHRLDRHSSGLVVFARTESAAAVMSEMLRTGQIDKRYLALVVGEVEHDPGSVSIPLCPTPDTRRRMRIAIGTEPDAMESETIFTLLEQYSDDATGRPASLLEAQPITGRTHQIRLHCLGIDHPILGDMIHGDKSANRAFRERAGLERQFLHARRLTFAHPVTGKQIDVESKLPRDLSMVLARLRDAEENPQQSSRRGGGAGFRQGPHRNR